MTKKDYELIAAALKRAMRATPEPGATKGIVACVNHVGHALANENPRFDRDRFNAACGIGGGE